ncbi:FAD:protein FMN transferase [soil metagenome]
MSCVTAARWQRRARPLLGTLVEIGWRGHSVGEGEAIEAAFAAIALVQSELSRFEPASEVSRFNAMPAGAHIALSDSGLDVFTAADELRALTVGLFDITLGSAPNGWRIDGAQLVKLDARARIDLGGIAKGHAVDRAVAALIAHGCPAGWVNAGGDLRAFGGAEVPVMLRDEAQGGVREFATLCDGAFATSHFAPPSRSPWHASLWSAGGTQPEWLHVSVAAPRCLWADALTKIVAASGDAEHPALARYDARAWLHG